MAETKVLDKEGIMELVRREVRDAWTNDETPYDPSATDLHEKLGTNHPEILEISKAKFHGGYVRLVKVELKKEGLTPPANAGAGNAATRRATRKVRTAVRSERQQSETTSAVFDRDKLHVALFDFGSEFVHADSPSERIAKLQNIDAYVDRLMGMKTS